MKSKQNKKNNKIETPTPIKTSRNWLVVMPGCGTGVVDASLESVDDVILDVVERVGLVERLGIELEEVELVVERMADGIELEMLDDEMVVVEDTSAVELTIVVGIKVGDLDELVLLKLEDVVGRLVSSVV
jgi:hypothetical protein